MDCGWVLYRTTQLREDLKAANNINDWAVKSPAIIRIWKEFQMDLIQENDRRSDNHTREFITRTEEVLLGKKRVGGKIVYENVDNLWDKIKHLKDKI
jgi:hypothetical protein